MSMLGFHNQLLLVLVLLFHHHTVNSLYIISFNTYADQHKHATTLQHHLGPPITTCYDSPFLSKHTHSWWHQVRSNSATQFPTDFITVTLGTPKRTVQLLRQLKIVRSVVEEKRHRSLLWSRATRDQGTTHYFKYRAPPFPFNPTDGEAGNAGNGEDSATHATKQQEEKRRRRRTLSSAGSGKRHDFGSDITVLIGHPNYGIKASRVQVLK